MVNQRRINKPLIAKYLFDGVYKVILKDLNMKVLEKNVWELPVFYCSIVCFQCFKLYNVPSYTDRALRRGFTTFDGIVTCIVHP